jgi:serine/threonine protein kinase
MTNWIGKTLGRVHIESLLARGGMAEVYLGTHTTLQRKVAVKILRPYLTDDPRLRSHDRFELEARAVAKLRHPNIVQVFDFDTVEDQPYLVMEYIPGPPLSKYLATLHRRGGRLGLPTVSRLLTRIAGALQYAHESGVIHRDVKPGNILLTSRSNQVLPGNTLPLDLEPVLTDFGLVRFLNASRQTASGLITGTPAYMSPEQALGEATDGRTDIYSLGIVLYEMLSGKVPFDAESSMSILLKHINEEPPPVPGLSPTLQRVLDRALAKNVDDRFQQPDEFAAAFNTVLEHTADATTMVTIPQVLEVAKANRVPPPQHRRTWLPAILAGALFILASAAWLLNGRLARANVETPSPLPPAVSDTPALGIPVTFGPTGNLHFEDGNAILDRAILIAQAMIAPPADSQYQVWLVNGQDRLLLGTLHVDGTGRGELIFDDPQARNLLAHYGQVEVTVESSTSPDPNSSTESAYAYALPEAGISYLRGLMVSFAGAPAQVGLIHGLTRNTELIDHAGQDLLSGYQDGDEAGVRESAESLINILAGDQSPDHKDWDGNGRVTDPGDGYGFFLNGNNLGYIQAVYSYADYAVNSPGASQNMIVNGGNVKECAENLARWAPELRNHASIILNTGTLSEMDESLQRTAELANQLWNGVDQNENGEVEPISGECGALVAHESTYHMADMPLLPVTATPLETQTLLAVSETVTPSQTSSSLFVLTLTGQPGQNQPPATVAATHAAATNEPAPPGHNNPRPTKKPKPTDRPNPPGNGNPRNGNNGNGHP